MLPWVIRLAALFTLCLLGLTASGAADDFATAYDQIERVLPGDAVAPGPDEFTLNEAQTREAIEHQPGAKRGLSRVVATIGRKGPADALGAVSDDLRAAGFPRLERHVFYHGWERTEDLVTGSVLLRKCDQGMLISLDGVKKTYRVDEPAAFDRERLLQRADAQRPGGGSLDVTRHVDKLQGRSIDGITADGFQTTQTLRTQAATGSCRVTTVNAQTESYYAPFAAPVSMCPRPAPEFPATPLAVIARDGCRPSAVAHASGTVEPSAPFVLYRLMKLTEGRNRLILLLARGHVRAIVSPAALFEIPPGYTKAT